MPATLVPRQRKRRFPERELLERLRKYEDLLRQNNINFESLHKEPAGEKDSSIVKGGYCSDDELPEAVGADLSSTSTTVKYEREYEAKNIWHAMNQGFREPDNDSDSSHDDVREFEIKKSWDRLFGNNDHLLFGSRETTVDLSTLHPEPAQIFMLWQIYLDHVNPLLKVTHTPSLQRRIVEAASNTKNIDPPLEALMFGIYCMSTLSLAVDDFHTMFNSSREELLRKYQFGCQQALMNCGFLRSGDRDCLTALYLYLVSVEPNTNPQSLSSMLAIAVRIAQRMGIHSESACAKYTALEAELRRRLWWSLILFDTRIGELAGFSSASLAPTWDCRIPLNVNDSDLRSEMKKPPVVNNNPTEALFVVLRSELGEFIRHATFHLDFTTPALKRVARNVRHDLVPEHGELIKLETMIDDKYLKLCDPENPLHFMTIWTTRAHLARCHLMEYYSRCSRSSEYRTEVQRDAAHSHALNMLKYDTKIMTSPLTKGYLWLLQLNFPFLAYMHIVQDMGRRPFSEQAEQAWEVMSDNYEARFVLPHEEDSPHLEIFTKTVLQAWETRDAAFRKLEKPLKLPGIVSRLRRNMTQMAPNARADDGRQSKGAMGEDNDHFPTLMSMDFDSNSLPFSMRMEDSYPGIGSGEYPNLLGQAPLDFDVNQLDWAAMDWDLVNAPAAGAAESAGPSPSDQQPGADAI